MSESPSSPLVSADWLQENLRSPGVKVAEISFAETDTAYDAGHIPGAIGWYWKALCWDDDIRELATPAQVAQRLGAAGVGPDDTLVLYGDPAQFGTYAFWVLRMAGHRDLRLLDGSRTRWLADARPLTADVHQLTPVDYPAPSGDGSARVGRDDVRAHLADPERILLDVRSPEEFRGERVMPGPGLDHGAERKGRIPGARHLFFRDILNQDDTYKSPDEIARLLQGVGIDPTAQKAAQKEIVSYCRLSHRATSVWFALSFLLGHDRTRIYDGSWTEWGSIVGFPIER